MNAIILRFGGFGDSLMLSALPQILKERYGFSQVHIGVAPKNIGLMSLTKQFDNITGIGRFSFTNEDFVSTDLGWVKARDYFIAASDKFVLFDFKFSIENNAPNLKAQEAFKQRQEWKTHINSNFQNWFDITLQWSRIDPTSIPDEKKRPILFLNERQKEAKEKLEKEYGDYLVASFNASSPLRGLVGIKQYIDRFALKINYKGYILMAFPNKQWYAVKYNGNPVKVTAIAGMDDILNVMPVIAGAKFGFFADSGLSHIAEALSVKHLTYYTTVIPATRNKYYKYEQSLEAPCSLGHCFSLSGSCPLVGTSEALPPCLRDVSRNLVNSMVESYLKGRKDY